MIGSPTDLKKKKSNQSIYFTFYFRLDICQCEIWYKIYKPMMSMSAKALESELDPGQHLDSAKQSLVTFAVFRGWTGPVLYSKSVRCSALCLWIFPKPLWRSHTLHCAQGLDWTGLDHTQNMSVHGNPTHSRSLPSLLRGLA